MMMMMMIAERITANMIQSIILDPSETEKEKLIISSIIII